MDGLITLLGLVVLVVGAEIMIRGAVGLALRARLSPLVVGLTVVSMGTSMPELLVSLMAALKGSSAIAIGNVVGSNIANISLVLGACIMILPLEVDRDARRIHWPVMMGASLLFVILEWDDVVQRWEGALFILLLIAYVTAMVVISRRQHIGTGVSKVVQAPLWRSLLLLLVGITGLGFGADRFVEGAVGLARGLGVSDQLVGVTIVALGTSLPELVTSLIAAIRKQPDISLGNLIGSNIFNLLGIIGVSAMVFPIRFDHSDFLLDLGFMLIIALVLYVFMRFANRLGRLQGVLLLALYVAYIVLVTIRG